jgi:nucleoporin GLE1
MRRAIKTSVNKLTLDNKDTNTQAVSLHPSFTQVDTYEVQMAKVKKDILKALKEIPSPPVKVNDFLPPHLALLDKNTTEVPGLVIYLLSIFSKAVINSFVGECVVSIQSAEPIGTMVAQVFSQQELQFKRNVPSVNSGIHYKAFGGTVPTPPMTPDSVSLISVLMCKFHAAAPPLFGISGSESVPGGKLRLGWRRQLDGGQKAFVVEQMHFDRLLGLGAGYAAISLRNFAKSPRPSPWPPLHYWETLSFIANTPPSEVQRSHLILLKGLLENSVDRFIQFFGDEAIATLRKVAIDFPNQLPAELQQTAAVKSIRVLTETWKRDRNLHLA